MPKMLVCRSAALALLVCGPLTGAASAQGKMPPHAQALAELRADVQGRADHQAYPIAGIDARDVRQVLAGLTSMDPEEWARAWAAMGERHAAAARAATDAVL